MNPAYPEKLETLGDHLRKARLDRGLYQSDVAKALRVTNDSINNWENNHRKPKVSMAKRIIEFLGYIPFELDQGTLGQRLFQARLLAGLTHKKLGKCIKVDPKTLAKIEKDFYNPFQVTIDKCERFINDQIES